MGYFSIIIWRTFHLTNTTKAVGQIHIIKSWNNYGLIEDIKVDLEHRRSGVGGALIAKAKSWTQKNNLRGLMLETQTNNVGACKFYESCGFRIGGFDYFLYQGIQMNTNEVAVFWYWFSS